MDNIIKRKYYETFLGAKKLYQKLKPDYPEVTLKQITEIINEQATQQIHKKVKIPDQEYNQIRAPGRGQFQLDLLDLSNYTRYNLGFKFVLVVVDIYSRYGFVRPLKTKSGAAVLKAMKSIQEEIQDDDVKIWSFCMDQGKEFDNKQWNTHFDGVKMYRKSPLIHTTTGIVERRNGFIRNLLEKYFTAFNTLKWYNIIQHINDNINNTINRTIKHTPKSIWNQNEKNEQDIREPPTQFKVGDTVRILNKEVTFEKASTGNYSNSIYEISRVDGLGYHVLGHRSAEKLFAWQLQKVERVGRIGIEYEVSSPKHIKQKRLVNKQNNREDRERRAGRY